jgi:hypothetical protein
MMKFFGIIRRAIRLQRPARAAAAKSPFQIRDAVLF